MNAPAETMLDLAALAREFAEAKRIETAAVERRRAIGALIAEAMPSMKQEGVTHMKTDGLKVSVTYGLNRTVDTARLQADWSKLLPNTQAAFRWKAEVATTLLKGLQGVSATEAATYITERSASPTVSVEVL